MARKSLAELLGYKKVFGDYIVIGEGKKCSKGRYALCRCKCGTEKDVGVDKLRTGRSTCCKSCAAGSEKRITSLTHGMSGSPEYYAWISMMERCNNPKAHNFKRYGARGITVCESWAGSFEEFFSDMGLRPSKRHSLDRKDNDKGYYAENCRWALPVEQSANRDITRKVLLNGEMVPVSILEKKAGLAKGVLSYRLDAGWSLDRALSEPGLIKKPKHSVFGEMLSTKEICDKFGVERQSFNMRLRQGWHPEEAVNHYRKH